MLHAKEIIFRLRETIFTTRKAIEAEPWNGETRNKDIVTIEKLIKTLESDRKPATVVSIEEFTGKKEHPMNSTITTTRRTLDSALIAMSLVAHAAMAEQADEGKSPAKFKGPVKVFVLAGQTNMEGQGVVSMAGEKDYNGGKGNLVWSMKNSKSAGKMECLKNEKGEWVVREDVQISFKVGDKVRKGGLTVGYTGYGGSSHIGPELGFGFVMGDYFEEPVLLIKTAWGGKSLYVDFRPPSSGGQVGPCYTKMVKEVRAALVELGDQKYEIAGFVWQQGWNDMCTKPAIPEYAQNLVNLVKDLRKEFNVPNMPVVVGELGNGGPVTSGDMFEFGKAQEEGTKQIKNGLFIETTDFARPAELSPNTGHGHHWYGNAESYFLIGDALGKGMVKLLDANRSAGSGSGQETRTAKSPHSEAGVVTEYSQCLHGYIGFGHECLPPGFADNAGMGFYAAAWPLVDQLGRFTFMAAAFMQPGKRLTLARRWRERGPTWSSVFQTAEGGLGYWAGIVTRQEAK